MKEPRIRKPVHQFTPPTDAWEEAFQRAVADTGLTEAGFLKMAVTAKLRAGGYLKPTEPGDA